MQRLNPDLEIWEQKKRDAHMQTIFEKWDKKGAPRANKRLRCGRW
jgi:hypothetical protein